MTSRADRESLVAEAEQTIAAGSKSFRFASRLFDQRTRERTWLLYAWCRACDDIADGQTLGHGAVAVSDPIARVARARALTDLALAGEKTGIGAFDALAVVAEECQIPRRFIEDHLQGFELDAAGWGPQDEPDLLKYCYHVAGTVGCMMAVVMGVDPRDEDTLRRASDLGIAFQLANIARDIVEDHGVGRIYLPRAWLAETGLSEADLSRLENREVLSQMSARLAELAEPFEASARIGAAQLPPRSRWAVLSAANIYGDIARRVVARGPEAWDSRTRVGRRAKLRHVARAFISSVASRPASAPAP